MNTILDLIKVALQDIEKCFEIQDNLYEKYIEAEVLKDEDLLKLLNVRDNNFNWQVETPLGGAGTTLNACVLYALIRHHNMCRVIETGVSGGYYSSFMLSALSKTLSKRQPTLTSLEISDDLTKVGKLVPFKLLSDKVVAWDLQMGKSSLEFLTKEKHWANMFSHDSLHTMAHMMKELAEFKKCTADEFFVFIDDEKSDDFWNRCLKLNAFNKPGYTVKLISGTESRLQGHLGGFVRYKKNG